MAAAVAIGAGTAVVGHAASLTVSQSGLGAATVAVDRCTTGALSVLSNLSAGSVVSVTIGSLPASCGTATLQVTVSNGLSNSGGSETVPAGGGSVTVALAVPTALTTQIQTDLVMVGP